MKNPLKRIVPLILVLVILASIGWYLLVYDRDFTRDLLLNQARFWDSQGHNKIASWFYDNAYSYLGQDEYIAIELAEQYKRDGNFTKAEYTLTHAIAESPNAQLYVALSKTFVQQDKLLDAVQMLDNISNPQIKAEVESLRPAVPSVDVAPGLYSQYLPVNLSIEAGSLYVSLDGEYPSVKEDKYQEAITLPGGETVMYALVVADDGLVSPLTVLNYTVGSVVEEAIFADGAVEADIRSLLELDAEKPVMTDALWDIREYTLPEDAFSIEDMKMLPYLESLTVTDKTITSLEPLAGLTELVTLRLENCKLDPESLIILAKLPSLQRLTLRNCSLSTIAALEGAQHLTYLDLSHNTLRNLDVLANMQTLYELDLSHNAVTDLSSLSALPALERLNVSYNSLTSLAPLAQNQKLNYLEASYNSISSLETLDQNTQLAALIVNNNKISDISVLGTCTNLVELDVSVNSISDIGALASLASLEKLDFSYNQVVNLPSWTESTALISIDGSYNQVESVAILGKMENLCYVYMDYNRLKNIDALANCYRLVTVNVYGNAIEDVSKLKEHNIIVNYDPS